MARTGTPPAQIAAQETADIKARDQQWQALLRATRAPSLGGPQIAAPHVAPAAGAFQSAGPFQSAAAPSAGFPLASPAATFGSSPFGAAPAASFGGSATAMGASQQGGFGAGFGAGFGGEMVFLHHLGEATIDLLR